MIKLLRTILTGGLLLSMAAASPAAAQTRGVRGGVNLSTMTISPSDALGLELGGEVGATGGVFMTLRKAGPWDIEVGGQLSMRRLTFGPNIADTVTYLEVPGVVTVGVMKHGRVRVRALGGGSFGYVVAARESVFGEASDSVKSAYNSVELAAIAGAQAELSARWSIDVRYLFGLTNPFPVDVTGGTARQRSLQVTAGYRFK